MLGTGEIAKWLGTFVVFAEDLSFIPSTYSGSQAPTTPGPGDPVSFSHLWGTRHTCGVDMQAKHSYTFYKINKSLKIYFTFVYMYVYGELPHVGNQWHPPRDYRLVSWQKPQCQSRSALFQLLVRGSKALPMQHKLLWLLMAPIRQFRWLFLKVPWTCIAGCRRIKLLLTWKARRRLAFVALAHVTQASEAEKMSTVPSRYKAFDHKGDWTWKISQMVQ